AVGSAVSASRLRRERDAAERAEADRTEQLRRSYLAQARFGRLTGRAGQGFGGLDAIRRALDLEQPGELAEGRLAGLRDEAIACLATPDLRVVAERRLPEEPRRGARSFDGRLERFSAVEPDGGVSVRRISDGEVEARIPPPPGFEFWYA